MCYKLRYTYNDCIQSTEKSHVGYVLWSTTYCPLSQIGFVSPRTRQLVNNNSSLNFVEVALYASSVVGRSGKELDDG